MTCRLWIIGWFLLSTGAIADPIFPQTPFSEEKPIQLIPLAGIDGPASRYEAPYSWGKAICSVRKGTLSVRLGPVSKGGMVVVTVVDFLDGVEEVGEGKPLVLDRYNSFTDERKFQVVFTDRQKKKRGVHPRWAGASKCEMNILDLVLNDEDLLTALTFSMKCASMFPVNSQSQSSGTKHFEIPESHPVQCVLGGEGSSS